MKFIKKVSNEKQKYLNITHGYQDLLDIISYEGLEENPDHIMIDGGYIRTLFISAYPYVAVSGWLNNLINFGHDIDISYHISEVESAPALSKLQRKITELESTKRAMIRDGRIVGPEISDPLDSATDLRNKIQRGQEKLFQMSIYISVRASSLEELNKITKLIESAMSSKMFIIKAARYRQMDALQSILPRSEDLLSQKRNLDSSTTSLTMPFISSELVQDSGILYGINLSNNSLVILDRFSLNNANSIVFAQSGSGKSYTTKVEIIRHINQGTDVIVIDPEREYKLLSDSLGGSYIKLSARSKTKINPFDNPGSNTDIPTHIQNLIELVSLMADGLDSREKAAADKAMLKIYKSKKIRKPLLEDLYAELKNLGQFKLCERLEKYISGSLSGVFNSDSNVSLDNNLIIFDIKDVPENLRQIMMLIVSNYVSSQVQNSPKKRLLIIDEGWLLLEHEESARFLSGLVRRARKYYLGVSVISQQASDFLNNDYGKAIASQSSLRILMRQDTTTIKSVSSEFNLSEFERDFLLTCGRGEALIIADQNHVAVKIIASPDEHPTITTKPQEIY